jgi:hypothetical protein
MNVFVTGPNGGQVPLDLHANIVLAVQSFAEQLGINRLKNNIRVRVHNKVYLDMSDGTEAL